MYMLLKQYLLFMCLAVRSISGDVGSSLTGECVCAWPCICENV